MTRRSALVVALAVLAFIVGAPALAQGTRLVMAIPAPVGSLDPRDGSAMRSVLWTVMEALVQEEADGSFGPRLATAWEIGEGGRRLTLRLREGVEFHDGRSFTSADAVASLEAMGWPEIAERIAAPDALTVVLDLYQPNGGAVLARLARTPILPAESTGTWGQAPVGTGPFRVERPDADADFTVVRFGAYWGEPAWADRVVFRVLTGPAYADAVIAGHVDLGAHAPSPADLPRLSSHRNVVVHRRAGVATYLGFNLAQAPLDDVRVRRALRQLLPRERLVAGRGAALPPGTDVGLSGAPDGVVPDAAAARRLLDEAGVAFQAPLVLIVREGNRRDLQAAEAVVAEYRRAGVPVVVEAHPAQQFLRDASAYDLFVLGGSGLTPANLPRYEIGTNAFWTGYRNDNVADLVRRADALDPASDEARDLYAEALRHVLDDVPSIFLFTEPRVALARSWLVGWEMEASQEFAFRDLHLVSRR